MYFKLVVQGRFVINWKILNLFRIMSLVRNASKLFYLKGFKHSIFAVKLSLQFSVCEKLDPSAWFGMTTF